MTGAFDTATPPTRVLLIGEDRRFRTVVAALLHRRGYLVSAHDRRRDIAAIAAQSGADVVVLDNDGPRELAPETVDELEALQPDVGLVVVGEPYVDTTAAARMTPTVEKWGPLEGLSEAIDEAVRRAA